MRKFLVVLLIFFAVVVVVADIAARSFAQSTIADQSAQHLGMSEEPEVSIEGWAFLPQAFGGTYSEININSDSATVDGHTFEQIDASARDVDAPLSELFSQPEVVAGELDGSAVVPYSFLNSQLPEGITITTGDDDEPRINGELAIPEMNISTTVSSGAEFSVEGDTLHVTPVAVEIGDAPSGMSDTVAQMLAFSVQVPELPFGLQITDLEAASGGLRISGTGEDVPLMGSEAA